MGQEEAGGGGSDGRHGALPGEGDGDEGERGHGEQGHGEREEAELSNGAFALAVIRRQLRRLDRLEPEVLRDRDPEDLHQLRVALRRLRTVLEQFRPALLLPPKVAGERIASLARRTGPCRDLDVLRRRLDDQLLPALPPGERRALRAWRQVLDRERREALGSLRRALRGDRWHRLLERLRQWQGAPRFTALGLQPLEPWLPAWPAPLCAALVLHPGWWEGDPMAPSLHGLRKRIKAARYGLEPLEPFCPPQLLDWISALRQAQGHLGELHDLQVLENLLTAQVSPWRRQGLPVLRAELQRQRREQWQQWRQQAPLLSDHGHRHSLQRLLLELGSPALSTKP